MGVAFGWRCVAFVAFALPKRHTLKALWRKALWRLWRLWRFVLTRIHRRRSKVDNSFAGTGDPTIGDSAVHPSLGRRTDNHPVGEAEIETGQYKRHTCHKALQDKGFACGVLSIETPHMPPRRHQNATQTPPTSWVTLWPQHYRGTFVQRGDRDPLCRSRRNRKLLSTRDPVCFGIPGFARPMRYGLLGVPTCQPKPRNACHYWL